MTNVNEVKEIAKEIATQTTGGMVIRSRRQTENLRSIINSKGKSISVTNLSVLEKGKIVRAVLMAPCNLETNLLKTDRVFVYTANNVARFVDNYTKDILNIDVCDTDFAHLVSGSIYRAGEGFDEQFYIDSDKPGMVYDLIAAKEVSSDVVFNADGSVLPGVLTYGGSQGGQGASASQARKSNITLACNNDVQAMIDRIDAVTYGSFSLHLGVLTTASGLVKYAARFNQYKAPSCFQDVNVDTFAVYMGKFKNVKGNQYRDGSAVIAEELAVKAFNTVDPEKYTFEARAVRGLAIQCRPWLTKVMGIVSERAYIKEIITFRGYEIVVVSRDTITLEIQKAFHDGFKGEGEFAGKVLIVVNTVADVAAALDNIDVYTDINGLKAEFDLKRSSGFNVLDIGNTADAKNGTSTSMQMLQSLMYADPAKAKEFIIKKGIEAIEANKARLLNGEASIPSVEEFSKLYAVNTVAKFAPEFVRDNSTKLFRAGVDNFMKGMSRDIGMLSFKVPGINAKIVPDFGADFEVELLGMAEDGHAEVYCPAAERYFTELGLDESEWIISGYKYPKMHFGEFLLAKVVSNKTLVARINASETLTKTQKHLLRRQYKALSEAVVVVPAIETLKSMLAGMDFDADAMSLVFDAEYNSIIVNSGLKPMAVVITDAAKNVDETTVTLGMDAGFKAFMQLVKNSNKTVGEITLMNDMFVSLLIMVRAGRTAEAAQVLSRVFKGDHIVPAYESPLTISVGEYGIPVQEISTMLMHKVVNQITEMELTATNMERALKDLITVERMLQERTIDSAKTNDNVEVPYDVNAVAALKSRSDLALAINWIKANVTAVDEEALEEYRGTQEYAGLRYILDNKPSGVVSYKNREGKKIEKFHVRNDFQETRLALARKLWTIALELKGMKQEFTAEQKAIHQQIVAREDVAPIKRAVVAAKLMYDDMTGVLRSELKGKNDEQKRLINAEYNRNIAALSNHVRRLTKHMDAVDRAVLLLVVGKDSNFAYTVCQEEFVLMVAAKYATIDFAGDKLDRCTFDVGETVSFVGGVANADGKTAQTRTAITGEFEIKEFNGKKYATKAIADLIVVPEINESQLVFKTHTSMAGKVKDIAAKMATGAHVQLKTFGGDQIVVDGEKVGKFDCQDAGGPLSKLYGKAEGIVEFATVGQSRGVDGRGNKVLIVVLNNAINSEVTEADITEEKRFKAEAKAAAKEATKLNGVRYLSGSTDF